MAFLPIHRLHTHARSCVPKTQMGKTGKIRARSYISLIWSLRLAYLPVVAKKSLFYLFKIDTVCRRSHMRRSFFLIPSPESLPWHPLIFLLLHQFVGYLPSSPNFFLFSYFASSSTSLFATTLASLSTNIIIAVLFYSSYFSLFFNLIRCSIISSHYQHCRARTITAGVVSYFSLVRHKWPLPLERFDASTGQKDEELSCCNRRANNFTFIKYPLQADHFYSFCFSFSFLLLSKNLFLLKPFILFFLFKSHLSFTAIYSLFLPSISPSSKIFRFFLHMFLFLNLFSFFLSFFLFFLSSSFFLFHLRYHSFTF